MAELSREGGLHTGGAEGRVGAAGWFGMVMGMVSVRDGDGSR